MAQINLLDSNSRTNLQGTRYPWLAWLMGALLVLTLLAYVILFFYHRSVQASVNDTRTKTQQAQNEASANTSREELLTRQGQLAALNPLIKDHLYWSGLLPELARVSLQQSSYTAIEATSEGSMVLSVSMPTYADLDKFLQVFDLPEYNRQFSNVRVLSISQSGDDTGQPFYTMQVELAFNPEFIKNVNL